MKFYFNIFLYHFYNNMTIRMISIIPIIGIRIDNLGLKLAYSQYVRFSHFTCLLTKHEFIHKLSKGRGT